jgi:hypothetical protein
MLAEPIRIHVAPDSEIARLIEKMGNTTVILERDGALYRLTKEENIWADYDPERTRLALKQSAGMFSEQEREELQRDIYAARGQDRHLPAGGTNHSLFTRCGAPMCCVT